MSEADVAWNQGKSTAVGSSSTSKNDHQHSFEAEKNITEQNDTMHIQTWQRI
jgi:hypothetical protein